MKQQTPKQFAKALRDAAEYLDKQRTTFHRDAAIIARDERVKGFDNSTSPDGEKWHALDPATIRRKKGEHSTQRMYTKTKGGPSGLSSRRAKASKTPEKPLIDTGAMRMPTVSATKNEGRVTMARSRSEVVSGAGSIARIHNEPGLAKYQRKHWGFYPNAIKRIQDSYEKLIKETVRKIANG